MGLVEIAVVLVVAAIVGAVLYTYFASTAKTLETFHQERPLSQARFAADQATLTSIRTSLQLYYGQHGEWPTTKEAVAALMSPPPAFQCEGNDSGQTSRAADRGGASQPADVAAARSPGRRSSPRSSRRAAVGTPCGSQPRRA